MQSSADIEAVPPAENPAGPVLRTGKLLGPRLECHRQRLVGVVLIFSDVLLALLAWEAALVGQALWEGGMLTELTITSVVPSVAVSSVAVWVGLRALLGLYPGYGLSQVEELRRQTYAVLATLAITAVFAVASGAEASVPRLALGLSCAVLLLLAPIARQFVKWRLMKVGLWGKQVIIFGSGQPVGRVATLLGKEWGLGYKPVAIFGGQPPRDVKPFEATPDERSLADAMGLSQRHGVDTVVFAMPHTRREHLAKLVHWASFGFRHVTVVPNLDGVANSGVVARDLAGVFGVEIRYNLLNPSVRRIKRALDLVATTIVGLTILPFLLMLCLLVWIESRGSVFYSAQRMGRDGSLFSCVKFRTMVPDAEAALQHILETDPESREEYTRYHKLHNDPRVTRVGRWLRKTSLDELPQLWNVLKGDMSLVGPRPYLPRESGDIGVTQSDILRVYPGMTGPWQVSGRSRTSFEERVKMDVYYVRDWSIWLDLILLARTVRTLVSDRSAY